MVAHRGAGRQIATLAIPSKTEIRDAVDAIPVTLRPRPWVEGKRTFLEISGGVARVYSKYSPGGDTARHYSPGRSQRAVQELASETPWWLNRPMALIPAEVGTNPVTGKSSLGLPLAEPVVDGRPMLTPMLRPEPRRITSWSARSRARLRLAMGRLDYGPLFEDGKLPALVTLTMPGKGWEVLTPTPRSFARAVFRFRLEYKRAWGSLPAGAWKMEFQRRGAPHLHILMTPPEGRAPGRPHAKDGVGHLVTDAAGQLVSLNVGGLYFKEWLSLTWAKIIGVHKLDADLLGADPREEFRKHVFAGTQVSRRSIERYADPRRIATYFLKHSTFGAKAYQNDMPQLWLDALAAGADGARFWGSWVLQRTDAAVELNAMPAPLPAKPRIPHPSADRYRSIMSIQVHTRTLAYRAPLNRRRDMFPASRAHPTRIPASDRYGG